LSRPRFAQSNGDDSALFDLECGTIRTVMFELRIDTIFIRHLRQMHGESAALWNLAIERVSARELGRAIANACRRIER